MSLRRIFALVVVLLVVAVLIGAASRSQKIETAVQRNLAVINKTKSLEVISVLRTGEEVYFAFRNDYDKSIMAYIISCGDKKLTQTRFTHDFAYSGFAEAGIPPHTVYERRESICTSSAKETNDPLIFEAVVLEGGDGDGNPAAVQGVTDEHLGGRIQIERTLKLLDDYLNLPITKTRLGDLKYQIASQLDSPEAENLTAFAKLQPARQANVLSEDVQSGLRTSKETILQELRDAENAQNPRKALLLLRANYERILRRL